ncbi:CatB-related O-acetyltransferase [Pseudocnuella soli]|uniref:CatB-related O-acetyltransferase n=1 Tax=Pseudocnuella soli TaxID=2502779 RepID=UPI0010499822|nr:CatB-related O-acetyltransferase [Pseudocnuella soli]
MHKLKFIDKIKLKIKGFFDVGYFKLTKESVLAPSAQIISSNLTGTLKISDGCRLNRCEISGKVEIGENTRLNKVLISGQVVIGRNTSIWGPNTDIYSNCNNVEVGNYCSIARNVSIQEFNHQTDRISTYFVLSNIFKEEISADITSKGKISIGHDVWIGAHCVILSGSTIGNGAIVAANSVVTGNVPPFAIVAGSPAKVIAFRFEEELIYMLQEISWWHWPTEKVFRNRALFEGRLTKQKLSQILP